MQQEKLQHLPQSGGCTSTAVSEYFRHRAGFSCFSSFDTLTLISKLIGCLDSFYFMSHNWNEQAELKSSGLCTSYSLKRSLWSQTLRAVFNRKRDVLSSVHLGLHEEYHIKNINEMTCVQWKPSSLLNTYIPALMVSSSSRTGSAETLYWRWLPAPNSRRKMMNSCMRQIWAKHCVHSSCW